MSGPRNLEKHLLRGAPYSVAPLSAVERSQWRATVGAYRAAVGFADRPAPLMTSPAANPKLGKSGSWGLSLLPAMESEEWNTCNASTRECRRLCLNTAGRGQFSDVQRARLWRVRLLADHPGRFCRALGDEVRRLPHGTPVRLNVLSDIAWERVAPDLFDEPYGWYDYTKRGDRGPIPPSYHLTVSATEHTDDDELAPLAAMYGSSVAVVFSTRKGEPLPTSWGGLSVVDGDEYDDRRRDPVGVVVGLRAKGRAIGTVGFVRDVCPSAAPVCRPRDLTRAVDGV